MQDYQYLAQVNFFIHRVCTPKWVILRQHIDFQDLTYAYAGKGVYLVDGVPYKVGAGDLISIPAGCWREAYTDPDDPLRLYALNFNLYDEQLQRTPLDLPILTHPGQDKELLYNLSIMERIWALKETTHHIMANSVLLAIISHLLLLLRVEKSSHGDTRVQAVADHVLKNLDRQITTEELAQLVSLHPVYLNTLVQKHTGLSLRTFVNHIKVNVAEDAIAHENLPVHEAAARCGFSNMFYFSKTFKKLKGYPPSFIRKIRN